MEKLEKLKSSLMEIETKLNGFKLVQDLSKIYIYF